MYMCAYIYIYIYIERYMVCGSGEDETVAMTNTQM